MHFIVFFLFPRDETNTLFLGLAHLLITSKVGSVFPKIIFAFPGSVHKNLWTHTLYQKGPRIIFLDDVNTQKQIYLRSIKGGETKYKSASYRNKHCITKFQTISSLKQPIISRVSSDGWLFCKTFDIPDLVSFQKFLEVRVDNYFLREPLACVCPLRLPSTQAQNLTSRKNSVPLNKSVHATQKLINPPLKENMQFYKVHCAPVNVFTSIKSKSRYPDKVTLAETHPHNKSLSACSKMLHWWFFKATRFTWHFYC